MDRLLSPASGLPDTRVLPEFISSSKLPKGWDAPGQRMDHGGNNPECARRLAASTITGVRTSTSQAGMQVSSQHYHVKHHLHFRDRPGCSLTGMEQSKESPFPSSMSSFKVGRIKLLSSAWKIGRVGRNEEPGSSDLL